MIFKLQHPQNLISRLFILEYMREIGPDKLYKKANKYQKESLFYKFTNEEDEEAVDINWEYCLFKALIPELETFMKNFMDEIQVVEENRDKLFKQSLKEAHAEVEKQPVDINIMDLANTELKKNREGGLKLN